MLTTIWLRGLLARRTGRLAITAIGIALAVGLLATLGSFLSSSKAQMTQRAIKSVGVDWQVEVQPGADPAAILTKVTATADVKAAVPVGYATAKISVKVQLATFSRRRASHARRTHSPPRGMCGRPAG